MTTEGQTAQTKDVDINGVKVTLPIDIADKVIAGRDADKAKVRELNEKYGKLEADAAAAVAKATKAEEEKAAIEHVKKGEMDRATELLTKTHREREAKLSAKARDKHLAALVASNEKVIKSAIPDIVEQLKGRSRYDFDTETVIVTDAAGQPQKDTDGNPVGVDSFISGWLEKRPHYLLDKTQKGSGGQSGQRQTGTVYSNEQFEKLSPREAAKFFADGGKLA